MLLGGNARGGNPASAPNNQSPNWVSSPNAGNTAWEKKSLGAFGNERGAIADVLHAFLVLKYYVFFYQTFLIFHFGGTE